MTTKSPAEIAAEKYSMEAFWVHNSDPKQAFRSFLTGAKWQKEQDAKEIAGLKEEIENYKYEMKEMVNR